MLIREIAQRLSGISRQIPVTDRTNAHKTHAISEKKLYMIRIFDGKPCDLFPPSPALALPISLKFNIQSISENF